MAFATIALVNVSHLILGVFVTRIFCVFSSGRRFKFRNGFCVSACAMRWVFCSQKSQFAQMFGQIKMHLNARCVCACDKFFFSLSAFRVFYLYSVRSDWLSPFYMLKRQSSHWVNASIKNLQKIGLSCQRHSLMQSADASFYRFDRSGWMHNCILLMSSGCH